MSASQETWYQYWSWVLPGMPEITNLNRPFWEATKRHELMIQRCKSCGEYQWYPRANCIHCGSMDIEWVKVSGKGSVYSYTIIWQVIGNSPLYNLEIPFAVGLIELDEGPRMYARIIGCEVTDVKVGMKVEVDFKDLTSEISIPVFRPVKE